MAVRSVDDSYFELAADPPFAFGTSPFRMRGVSYHRDQAFSRANTRGGLDALLAELPPELRRFFAQRFSPSQWYDALPGR